jgi:hypothetical protein
MRGRDDAGRTTATRPRILSRPRSAMSGVTGRRDGFSVDRCLRIL